MLLAQASGAIILLFEAMLDSRSTRGEGHTKPHILDPTSHDLAFSEAKSII